MNKTLKNYTGNSVVCIKCNLKVEGDVCDVVSYEERGTNLCGTVLFFIGGPSSASLASRSGQWTVVPFGALEPSGI